MFLRVYSLAFMCVLLCASAITFAHVELDVVETAGVLERGIVERSSVRINGNDYRISPNLTVKDPEGRILGSEELRRGQRVLLRSYDDEVFEIVVEPAGAGRAR